jgi:hypothetical protein
MAETIFEHLKKHFLKKGVQNSKKKLYLKLKIENLKKYLFFWKKEFSENDLNFDLADI